MSATTYTARPITAGAQCADCGHGLARICDWCDDDATFSVRHITDRGMPWHDHACGFHLAGWFSGELVAGGDSR